jgi:hypothetical protein
LRSASIEITGAAPAAASVIGPGTVAARWPRHDDYRSRRRGANGGVDPSRPVSRSGNAKDQVFPTFTWNNRPPIGAKQGAGKAIGLTSSRTEWDVTAVVKQQIAAGASKLSLAIQMDATSPATDTFNAREGLNKPQLTVTYGADAPPSVAAAAAASPTSTTGNTTALSALGADDRGEAALTYTWSVLGSAFGTATFSANGTSSARRSTATMAKAGTYDFRVVIQDGAGQQAVSFVTVVVNPVVSTITVTPSTATVASGATQRFDARARDQFGNVIDPFPAFTWSVSGGGTVAEAGNGIGQFTAGATAGGPFTVSATTAGKTGTASVTVTGGSAPPPITPSADLRVRDGSSAAQNFGTAANLAR